MLSSIFWITSRSSLERAALDRLPPPHLNPFPPFSMVVLSLYNHAEYPGLGGSGYRRAGSGAQVGRAGLSQHLAKLLGAPVSSADEDILAMRQDEPSVRSPDEGLLPLDL
ncbi:unnamed protein product [Urochloa humidicola]